MTLSVTATEIFTQTGSLCYCCYELILIQRNHTATIAT